MSWSHRLLRLLPASGAAVFLASCSYMGGDIASLSSVANNLWNGPQLVSLEEAASVPYASIGVRLGGYNQIMLVLATNTEDQQLWTSDARIAITTKHGHIIRTAGFGRDLSSLRFSGPAHPGDTDYTWEADFKDLGLYAVTGHCRRTPTKNEAITVLGKSINTQRIEEHCQTDGHQMKWSFQNTYWQDPDSGFIWKSTQHTHPKLPEIEVTIFRPYR